MSADITITSTTQRLIVDVAAKSVSVVLAGPVGPPGGVTNAALAAAVASLQAQLDDHEARLVALEP